MAVSAEKVSSTEWKKVFQKLARLVKQEFSRRFPFKDDGDVAPELLSLRDGIYAFPVPTRVLLFDTEGAKTPFSEGIGSWTIVRYDLSRPGENDSDFYGVIKRSTLAISEGLIMQVCKVKEIERDLQELLPTSVWDDEAKFIVQVIPYDIREALPKYAEELYSFILDHLANFLQRQFPRKVDFNKKYTLNPDPILDRDALLQADQLSAAFVKFSDGKPITLEERQEEISCIQLIPQVPESVRRTFNLAKRLYVFGHFVYGFFTVSQHYAYLALEAAIHSRWSAMLSKPAKLSFGSPVEIHNATYWGIRRQCRSQGEPMIDGERIPHSTGEVLKTLQKKAIITKWQMSRLKIGIDLRNSLSHLEFAPVHMPSVHTLSWTAELINQMFDSLPTA